MPITVAARARYLLLFVVIATACSIRASAQAIRFVQLTDIHLFDPGQDETDNKAALAACVKSINERIAEGSEFKFAVLTGDIGIENLVSETRDGKRLLLDQAKRESRLEQGAADLASILSASRIRIWLFLPGNNDLYEEHPDTQYYREFIHKLQSKLRCLEVIDLCPEEPEGEQKNGGPKLGVYSLGDIAFIGFNNASFKNNNEPDRLTQEKDKQLEYVRQVERRVKPDSVQRAYVFYHIPEVDDPHLVLNSDAATLAKRKGSNGNNPYLYSSWFVDSSVREEWTKKVVSEAKVRGLFAGHYHDWRRATYTGYHWLETADYLSGNLSKLFICPPLAIKRQRDEESQARGFQEVEIDPREGRVTTKILWLTSDQSTFDTDPAEPSKELQLALTYERAGRWREAETNFAEAAKSARSASALGSALAGIKRVEAAQDSGIRNVLWRLTDPLWLGALLLRVLLIGGGLVYLYILVRSVLDNRSPRVDEGL
jgi:hypothetical protein